MKKVLLTIIALFVLCANPTQASNLSNFSDDSKIMSALEVLENIGSSDVFQRLSKNSVKIIFYDLSLMDYSYAKHYAVSSTDELGNNYILINERFRNSSKEALACLIAHESVHQLPQATLEEEVKATKTEALTWIKVRNMTGLNTSDDLTKREIKLSMMYQSSTDSRDLIKESIAGNSFYQEQLAMK